MTNRGIDWLTNWLTNWLTDRLTDWMTDRSTDKLTERINEWLTIRKINGLNKWMTDWRIDWSTDARSQYVLLRLHLCIDRLHQSLSKLCHLERNNNSLINPILKFNHLIYLPTMLHFASFFVNTGMTYHCIFGALNYAIIRELVVRVRHCLHILM